MSFPIQLFRKGGPYGRGAKAYSVAGAETPEQAEMLIAKGWHPDKAKAIGVAKKSAPKLDDVPAPEPELTGREQLEAKADELGIEYRSNWKDETIARKIKEALA
jgi:hypothetical protein